MSFDISALLADWPYRPGEVVVRRFTGQDGVEKIQLRVDLGIMQMNASGRPDGERPHSQESLLQHHLACLARHRQAHEGEDEGFQLNAEDCVLLQQEAIQYHHRYICLFQLEDFDGAIRDTERNLQAFDFVSEFAETDEMAWALEQFRPQLLMMNTRARGAQALQTNRFDEAIQTIEDGLEAIRTFFREHEREEVIEHSGEIQSLRAWLGEIQSRRPMSERERLQRDLDHAVQNEDYEKAAKVRDALRNLP